MTLLDAADHFPDLTLKRVGGGSVSLPADLAGVFGVVLVYRGSWCPYCNAQLGAFSRATEALDEQQIKVIALSVDDEATGAALVEKNQLMFPVAYGADAGEVAEALGCFTNDEPAYLQSTGFVLTPDGSVLVAVYSTGAIGRLLPADVLGLVAHARSAG